MYSIKQYLAFLFLVPLVLGCTKEDLSMCPEPEPAAIGVRFSYTHNPLDKDLFFDEVAALSVFAFDERDVCVAKFVDQGETLDANYVMQLKGLARGRYKLVAWGDLTERSSYLFTEELPDGSLTKFEMEKTLFDRARIILNRKSTGDYDVPDDLYHGLLQEVEVADQDSVYSMSLIKNTNLIRTTVRGLDKLTNNAPAQEVTRRYTTTIAAHNGKMAFDNRVITKSYQITYLPQKEHYENSHLLSEKRILRMQTEIPVILSIKDNDTGDVIAELDVVKVLLGISGNGITCNSDFDRYDTYDITVDVRNWQVELTVTINGWTVKIVKGGLA